MDKYEDKYIDKYIDKYVDYHPLTNIHLTIAFNYVKISKQKIENNRC